MRLKDPRDTQKIPFGVSVVGALDITMGALGLLSFAISLYALIYWVGCTTSEDLECIGWSGVTCLATLFLLGLPLSPAIILGKFILKLSVLARIFQFIYSSLLILYFLLIFFIIRPNGNFNFLFLFPCGISIFTIWYLLRPHVKELFNEPTPQARPASPHLKF
jgi:hypothetical protein